MMEMSREELLEKIFRDDFEHLKGKKLRMTRVRVPGKEVCMAHILCPLRFQYLSESGAAYRGT